jgi:hypothetical protein
VVLPPVAVKVVVDPEQIVVVPVIAVGAVAAAVIFTVTETHEVIPPHASLAA